MDLAAGKNPGTWKAKDAPDKRPGADRCGVEPAAGRRAGEAEFYAEKQRLCLLIPAGSEPLDFMLWTTRGEWCGRVGGVYFKIGGGDDESALEAVDGGGPARWPQTLTTEVVLPASNEPFVVDVLTHPEANPWLAQTRFTGLDFYPDGDRMIVTAWDGDVWLVSGISQLDAAREGWPKRR